MRTKLASSALAAWLLLAPLLFGSAALLAPAVLNPGAASAQEELDPAEARTENIPGGMLMVVAYGIVFACVLGYVFSIGFRQAGTARELERLRRDIESADPDAAKDRA